MNEFTQLLKGTEEYLHMNDVCSDLSVCPVRSVSLRALVCGSLSGWVCTFHLGGAAECVNLCFVLVCRLTIDHVFQKSRQL